MIGIISEMRMELSRRTIDLCGLTGGVERRTNRESRVFASTNTIIA